MDMAIDTTGTIHPGIIHIGIIPIGIITADTMGVIMMGMDIPILMITQNVPFGKDLVQLYEELMDHHQIDQNHR